MATDPRPRPGSDAAVEQGCTCPVEDNHRGLSAPVPPSGWYVEVGCPVHDPDGGVVGGQGTDDV